MAIDKKDRICMYCEHLEIEHSCMGSEWTGEYGEDGFSCRAGVFCEYDDEANPHDTKELRSLFSKAATCDKYSQSLDK